MRKRVLILSASVGAGHLRAAQAVELAAKELDPTAEVVSHDVLVFTSPAFRQVYGKAYLDLVNRAPYMLGIFYDMLDRPPSPQQKSDKLRRLVERLNLQKLLKLLTSERWDIVVSTHFLPAEMIALLKRKEKFFTPQFTVTTDFETHRLWVNQPCEHYFTATEEGAEYLKHWGVPSGDVSVSGIPIQPEFGRPLDRPLVLKKHGLAADRPIILQLSGGFGVGPIEQLYRALLDVKVPLQVIVGAGRNHELKSHLEPITSIRHKTKVIGYTDVMHEIMSVADLVLSKPGGLTTSEALASGAAIAIVNPIPGQESRNSDFLLENQAAIKINNVATLAFKITRLIENRDLLRTYQSNARRLGRPEAAFTIARRALDAAEPKTRALNPTPRQVSSRID
jgi:processive 1,2-diacylglycerol beta-glucosyltransferase